jgi:hypothetical protein
MHQFTPDFTALEEADVNQLGQGGGNQLLEFARRFCAAAAAPLQGA